MGSAGVAWSGPQVPSTPGASPGGAWVLQALDTGLGVSTSQPSFWQTFWPVLVFCLAGAPAGGQLSPPGIFEGRYRLLRAFAKLSIFSYLKVISFMFETAVKDVLVFKSLNRNILCHN